MTKCYICEKGQLKKKEVPYAVYGEHLGNFMAEVCSSCGETFFDEETSQKMTDASKARGLWGLGTQTKIGQAGSTLDIRLPQRLIRFLQLKKGKEVTIYPENKRKIVIEV